MSKRLRQLRWRLIAAQALAAMAGFAIILLATRIILLQTAPDAIRPNLIELTRSAEMLEQTEEILLIEFRNAVLLSVLIATMVAIGTSLLSSYVLWREIIQPLQQIAQGSNRIADGR